MESPLVGFYGCLWSNSPNFQLHILDQDSRFIVGCINDGNNNYNWLVSFVYGYPHYHLQKNLWKLIGNITDKDSKPWLISGDFSELSSLDEKLSFY